jgi:hypothetical protein
VFVEFLAVRSCTIQIQIYLNIFSFSLHISGHHNLFSLSSFSSFFAFHYPQAIETRLGVGTQVSVLDSANLLAGREALAAKYGMHKDDAASSANQVCAQ